MKKYFILYITLFVFLFSLNAEAQNNPVSISEKTKNMKLFSGYFNFYWDETEGKIWLEIDKFNTEFLYVNSLVNGVGSNDIGLDRNQIGDNRVVKFERYGPKILLTQINLNFKATSNNELERRAVEQSFAKSALHGFTVAAEENGKVLVDATSFYFSDAHNVISALSNTNQGNFSLDVSRSAFYLPNIKNFPLNTEVEVILTFTGINPGGYVQQVVPTPTIITVHQRHSFVKLPDDKYKPRENDPRSGYFGISYADYSTPLGEPMIKKLITRHRLKKKNPNAEKSEAVEPIIYYVDSGVPEPVQSALVEGALWWNQAFEAAGFINAFQVKILPADADPMDVRYNVINWVHRSTRGWSYGGSVIDPRTGEIIKGHVLLGSLRIRQDYLIAEGLLSPYKDKSTKSKEAEEMALARIRQLSAHEVGHTLGLDHNFAASTFGRASVMDYPHPFIKLKDDGTIDLSDAYDNKIGEWDKVAITYGYKEFKNGEIEKDELNKIMQHSIEKGMIYIGDRDARSQGGLHSTAHLWDNGADAGDELARIMKVRKKALENFSENNIPFGRPMADLEDVFVPVYLLHRYQTEAAVKMLGGAFYTYAVKGDGQITYEKVSPEKQKQSLNELINTISAENLLIPEKTLNLFPPKPANDNRDRENFKTYTGFIFDPVAAAQSAADLTLKLIFNPERASRLVEQNSIDSKYPSLDEVVDKIINSTWKKNYTDEYSNEINRAVSNLVLDYLFQLAANKNTLNQVNAVAAIKINELKEWITKELNKNQSSSQKSNLYLAQQKIDRFIKDPSAVEIKTAPPLPDGSPIGF